MKGMNPIQTLLDDHGVMVLDGALATELERRGCDLHDPLWSARVLIEAPWLIKQVHADYFAAGADCATTATYQATYEGFARRGLSCDESDRLLRLAVSLAVEARDEFWADPANRAGRPKPLVAASIGSYGAFLADGSEYTGAYNLSESELRDFHRPRMAILAASEADVLAFETMPNLIEARALTELLGEFPGRTAWMSFSARDAAHICHGEKLTDCVATLDGYDQIVAIGVNCTAPHFVPGLVEAAHGATSRPIVVYPNSGETYSVREGGWSGDAPDVSFGQEARAWYDRGARLIGGCCRTTPDDIRAIAAWARSVPGRFT